MDKKRVLDTFVREFLPLTPDRLRSICLKKYARTSVYAYLLRLERQSLLERTFVGGKIAYRITRRGVERLEYLRSKQT